MSIKQNFNEIPLKRGQLTTSGAQELIYASPIVNPNHTQAPPIQLPSLEEIESSLVIHWTELQAK